MSYSPRGPKSPKQSTGWDSVLSPWTSMLICVLMDSHGRPTHTDTHGHTRTHTDVLCVLTDTTGCPVQPTWAKITQTVHGTGQRAESKDQRADMCTDGLPRTSYSLRGPKLPKQSTGRASVLSPSTSVLICVLMDSHRRPVCADGHTRPHTDTHGQPRTQPTWAKITRTVHGKGQRAESKDQHADICTDGQPQMSCVHTQTATDILCVLTDTHGHTQTATDVLCPRTSCVCWRTPTDVLCVLNRQPTWAKITRTVHGKGQHAESKDQRADMCTDGQPRTSCVPRGPKSPEQSTGRASVLICVLMDSHGRPDQRADMCTDGQPRTSCVCCRTHMDSHGRPVCTDGHTRTSCPTWAKITRTVHGKGQRAESKDQRADMCTDGQPQTHGILCVLADTH
ncbi:unnamed protein product, partial [Brassica rapa]